MIEIPIWLLATIAAVLVIATATIGTWFALWILLAFTFDWPDQPSWRTAVPAAVVVLFGLLCALKVIVFV